VRVLAGFTESGTATAQWLTMLRRRVPDADAESWARQIKPPTAAERAWLVLIRARAREWPHEIRAVAAPFHPVPPPADVVIVVGNRGGEDAFTHDPTTIGFDLSALERVYGQADATGNADRLDRFFRHEYTHLMQKAWRAAHPVTADTPLDRALAEIWAEGLGNYYSLAGRWRSVGGGPSPAASETLAVLGPRFVTRIAALACVRPDVADGLTADLSWGRFDRKWGALPVALWLEQEVAASEDVLRAFVRAGPEGVWELAQRHLSPSLAAVISEARVAATLCRER